jgi:hypothetical protein
VRDEIYDSPLILPDKRGSGNVPCCGIHGILISYVIEINIDNENGWHKINATRGCSS